MALRADIDEEFKRRDESKDELTASGIISSPNPFAADCRRYREGEADAEAASIYTSANAYLCEQKTRRRSHLG